MFSNTLKLIAQDYIYWIWDVRNFRIPCRTDLSKVLLLLGCVRSFIFVTKIGIFHRKWLKSARNWFCNLFVQTFWICFHAWFGGFWVKSGSENLDPDPDQAWKQRRLYFAGTQTLLEIVISSKIVRILWEKVHIENWDEVTSA